MLAMILILAIIFHAFPSGHFCSADFLPDQLNSTYRACMLHAILDTTQNTGQTAYPRVCVKQLG